MFLSLLPKTSGRRKEDQRNNSDRKRKSEEGKHEAERKGVRQTACFADNSEERKHGKDDRHVCWRLALSSVKNQLWLSEL